MNIIKEIDGNNPTRHFCFHCGTKTTLIHLLPTSSKIGSRMQSTVTLVMDQSLVEVMICPFVTILKFIIHTAILVTLINFLMVMYMKVNEQGTFLLVSTSSKQQKLKSLIEHLCYDVFIDICTRYRIVAIFSCYDKHTVHHLRSVLCWVLFVLFEFSQPFHSIR